MSTENKDLRGYLMLMPPEDTDPKIQAIRCKIRKAYETDVKVSEFVPEEDDQKEGNVRYNQFIIKADINFGPFQDNQIRKENILRRFCQENCMSGIGESWLHLNIPDINEVIHENKPILNGFALGSLIYMNSFVEHFCSLWSEDDPACRITQSTAHFKHDIRKLEVNFMVANRKAKEKTMQSHQLHMLELEYNMIIRVLVEIQKQPNRKANVSGIKFLRIYLLMNGAPLLKVREVLDEDDEVDDEEVFCVDKDGEVLETDKIEQLVYGEKGCDATYENGSHNFADNVPDPKGYKDVKKVDLSEYSGHRNGNRNMNGSDKNFRGNSLDGNFKKNNSKPGKDNFSRHRSNRNVDSDKEWKKKQPEKSKYVSASFVSHKMMYRRVASFGEEQTKAHCSSKMLGLSKILRLDLQSSQDSENETWNTVTQLIACCPEAQVFFTSMKIEPCLKEFENPSLNNSNFECLFALKTVTSPSFSIADEIKLKSNLKEINQKLNAFAAHNSLALEKTLFEIQEKYDKGDIICFGSALESLFRQNDRYFDTIESRKSLPSSMVLLRRALLTPTRLVFLPPIAHMKSYLLRNTDPQFALRVTIRDDNFDQLTFTNQGSKKSKTKFLKTAVGDKLLKGIKIGKRQYEFFGSSTSQLREHGCLFYAKDFHGNTAQTLRDGLGDFSEIDNVAKFIARMGQSLSQAMANFILPKTFVIGPVPDVKRNDYTFSDGIGQMSNEVLEMCHKALGLKEDDYKPCAIQIRYAGCKGMVVLNPKLNGKMLILRKSMWKFNSDSESFEILKGNYPQCTYLNRPFVTILEQMGVPNKVLFDLQSKHLNRVVNSLYKSTDAQSLLHEVSVLRLPFKTLHNCGIDLSLEPFFRPMIMAIYNQTVEVLKKKCRIKLPFSEARTMFGVLDETDTLESGQVFVQYTNCIDEDGKPSKETTVLQGEILITKNPCMHPGDVRKFEAVYVKDLMHIKDCLVFPQKGDRPHPDEMAGSDLDGDEYCVIWYKPLIFERSNVEPMDYRNDKKLPEKPKIDVKDMVNFVTDYIRDDCVGLIASAHLAWADTIGIFDPICMSIAKKYSVTLDFAKSGQPERLSYNERVRFYPDFMEKFREKDCYLSNRALGHLFRNCKHIEMVASILSAEVPVEVDPALKYEGWTEYEEDANRSLDEYVYLFSSPTRLYRLTNEGEIMSGAIKKLEKTFQGKNIEKNIAKMLESLIPYVMRKMKDNFYREFLKHPQAKDIIAGSLNEEQKLLKLQNNIFARFRMASRGYQLSTCGLLNEMLKKVSAWYMVAYKKKQEGATLYLGLPWVVCELLGILRSRQVSQKPSLQLKLKSFLDSQVKMFNAPSDEIVEMSKEVMTKWLQETNLRSLNVQKVKKMQMMKMMMFHIDRISKREDLPASIEELIYEILTSMAQLYTKVPFDDGLQAGEVFWLQKELGCLAIVGLSVMTCTGKLWESEGQEPTQSPQALGLSFLNREFREEIRFRLDLGKQKVVGRDDEGKPIFGRSEFGEVMLQNSSDIGEMLSRKSKVRMVKVDFKEPKVGDRWYVLLSVYGKIFSIEMLKEFVVQPSFPKKIIEDVRSNSV